VTLLIITFFTLAGAACVAVVIRVAGPAQSVATQDGSQAELASLRELVLELRRELRAARREAEQARLKAVSSTVNLQRALGPGGDVELVVAEQLRDAMARPGAEKVRLSSQRQHVA